MYKHLDDSSKRARLTALRAGVEPILANNLLPYFTAHDVQHCDRVTEVIDSLIEPLQQSAHRLTNDELFVLYAAAYLHDVGMHYERVGDSTAIRASLGSQSWDELPEAERRDLPSSPSSCDIGRAGGEIGPQRYAPNWVSTHRARPPCGCSKPLRSTWNRDSEPALCRAHRRRSWAAHVPTCGNLAMRRHTRRVAEARKQGSCRESDVAPRIASSLVASLLHRRR